MNLADYPDRIHSIECKLIKVSKDLATLADQIQLLENTVDLDISYNPNFKNELQRKAGRSLMLNENQEYLELLKRDSGLSLQRQQLIADLNHAKNSFSVAKLDKQLEIALRSPQYSPE